VLTFSSQCHQRFTNWKEELDEFMDCRGISMGLRLQVKNHYDLKFPSQRIFDEPGIMASLPRGLLFKLATELFADMMQTAPLFMACGEETKREACYLMRTYNCMEGTTVSTEGEVATHLYLVRLGLVRITRKGEDLAVLERGEMFGENAIFSWSCDGKRTRTAVALTLCDLCVLSVQDVVHLLEEHNSFYFSVRRIVDAHSARLRIMIDDGLPVSTPDIYMIGWRVCGEKIMAEIERLSAVSNQEKDVNAMENQLNQFQHLGDAGASGDCSVQKVPHHVLQTHFRVLALALQTSLQPGDFSYGQFVSVEISFNGMPGVPTSGVHVESHDTLLCLKNDGGVSFIVSIGMDIYHESNSWDELGDVHVSILDKGINLSRAHGKKSPPGPPAKALSKSSSGMQSGEEDRKVLWSGTVTLAELVRHRVVDTNVRKIHPTIEIHMQPHPNRQKNGVAVLQLVTRLKRVLRSGSVWRRIYFTVRNTLSKSFLRRQMELSRSLHARFHEKMDTMLMSRATSVFNDFKADFFADKDLATSPLNERNARHASHKHPHAHSSGYQHHSHTRMCTKRQSPHWFTSLYRRASTCRLAKSLSLPCVMMPPRRPRVLIRLTSALTRGDWTSGRDWRI
jgi:CRP-like cAMP-binding protein